MATANISLNPLLVGSAAGTFGIQSEGYIQGTLLDDPVDRQRIAGGVLAASATVPIWGGTAIIENVPYPPIQNAFPQDNLGSIVSQAGTTAAIQGFALFNQMHHWLTTQSSDAPSAGSNMGVGFVRMKSGARIVVKADPALASLEGGAANVTTGFTWDCVNQVLQPYQASAGTASITGITVSNGVATATLSGAVAGWTLTAGDTVGISGATNSGTAPVGLLNQDQKITSIVSSTVFTFNLPTNQGTWGTIGGTILLNYGGGALAVQLLALNIGNSLVVNYDPQNNLVQWDRAGTTAVILLS